MEIINPIKILVFGSFCFALANLRRDQRDHQILLGILAVCLLTELITSLLIWRQILNTFFISCSIIVHDLLWLALLARHCLSKKLVYFCIVLFLLVGLTDMFFLSALHTFKYYTFAVGGLLYISIFIYENLLRLHNEDISYFISNDYLILAAPVLFFLDLSLMFGFDSFELTSYRVLGVKLYDLIIYFVNGSYYLLINLYVYRQRNSRLCFS